MQGISLREYGRRHSVSGEAVRKAIKTGRLSKSVGTDSKGWPVILDAELADAEWAANTSTARSRRVRATVTEPKACASNRPTAPTAPAEEGIDPVTGVPPRSVSDARRAHWEAVKAQAQAEETTGSLLQREAVVRSAFAVAREVRDRLLLIEDRLADQLAAITDPGEVRLRLREEFRTALEKLSADVTAGGADAVS